MLFENPYFRSYLVNGLEETPRLLRFVLSGMTDEQADARLDPNRFTLREAVAHLADWETVFGGRIERIVNEDNPELPNIDEGQRAIDKEYGKTDWREQLDLFCARREQRVRYLLELPVPAWARTGLRPEIGTITIFDQAQLMVLHDVYHIRQAREYLTP